MVQWFCLILSILFDEQASVFGYWFWYEPLTCISAYSGVLKFVMKIFVNVARLEIGQLFTRCVRWGRLCTLDTFLVEGDVLQEFLKYYPSKYYMDRVKRIWYLSPMRAAKVQASLRIRAVSPEPPLLAYTSSDSRGTFRQKARSLAPLNGWACAVEICHDRMLEDTNSLDGAHITEKAHPKQYQWLSV